MKRFLPGLAAFTLLLPCLASAHDLWIEPSTFRPAVGENVTASLRVGQRLHGESVPRIPGLVDRFFVKGEGAESPIAPLRLVADPAGYARVSEAGLHWIGYQSHPFPLALDARKFEEEYLKEEGLERIVEERARKGQSSAPGRERFYRCAKSLLEIPGEKGGVRSSVPDVPLGFTLELVPRKNPYGIKPGGELPLLLLFRGKPISNVLVVAMTKDDAEKAVSARTDSRGFVTLRLARPGFWLVKAVHMEAAPPDAGVDWESWWASITFDLPGGVAK